MSVRLGNGDGTFGAKTDLVLTAAQTNNLQVGDINNDGYDDVVAYNVSRAFTILGNGDGTFQAARSFSLPNGSNGFLVDVNDDGNLDVIGTSAAGQSILFGNGDGTLRAPYSSGSSVNAWAVGDFRNNGVNDFILVAGNATDFSYLAGNFTTATTLKSFSLRTRSDALASFAVLDAAESRIHSNLAQAGATQSRFASTLQTLQISSVNYLDAESRITDADTAEEAAQFARLQILQQSAQAVLAQSNQQPDLALRLLGQR